MLLQCEAGELGQLQRLLGKGKEKALLVVHGPAAGQLRGKGWMSKLRPRVQTHPHKYKLRKELDEKGAWESSSDRLLRLAALEHVWSAKQGPMT